MNRFVRKGKSLIKGVFSGFTVCSFAQNQAAGVHFLFLKNLLIYLGWAGSFLLSRAFPGSGGYSSVVVCGRLIVVASLVAEEELNGTIGRTDLAIQLLCSSFSFYICTNFILMIARRLQWLQLLGPRAQV